ncbi:hypothetical protein MAP00_001323 [Monascus purpureus]|nr:hypothetical protein MAP00_001323 [Monascus purpureus]
MALNIALVGYTVTVLSRSESNYTLPANSPTTLKKVKYNNHTSLVEARPGRRCFRHRGRSNGKPNQNNRRCYRSGSFQPSMELIPRTPRPWKECRSSGSRKM